mmetsp:Transcript_20070/g.42840  ORF Transcript_20070/g.42840 Transcript_20070/m.42840 type:complete len:164 (-) Transcript_20070:76-567(-)
MGNACACDDGREFVDPNEKPDQRTLRNVKDRIDRKLFWSGGLPFKELTDMMEPKAYSTCSGIAEILKAHPHVGLRIHCYTAQLLNGQDKQLSQGRADAIYNQLSQEGCKNVMSAQGYGYADSLGPRIELIACDPMDISLIRGEVQWLGEKTGRACQSPGCAVQ